MPVRFAEQPCNMPGNRDRLSRTKFAFALESSAKALAFEQLHDDEGVATFEVAVVVNLDDARVLNSSGRTRLVKETLDDFFVAAAIGKKNFYGSAPPQKQMLSLVDRTHATSANLASNAVASYDVSYHARSARILADDQA